MERFYSTLELAGHDETARAPELVRYDETARALERDYDATAFELDASALAPQAVADTTPQVYYDTSFPEPHGNNEESTKEHVLNLDIIKPSLKWLFVLAAVIIAMAMAIAVGAGVGIWRHREHSSQKLSPAVSLPAPPNPNANVTRASQIILNDTSLAALSLANGDWHQFFQDNNGLIRRLIRTASNSRWSTSADQNLSLSSNPKINTPLTANINDFSEINLYYISESHFLNRSAFFGGSWLWAPSLTLGKNYSTAVGSPSLSITSIEGVLPSTNTTINSALLYYENPTGNVSALLQRTSITFADECVDITSQASESLPNEFRNSAGQTSNTLYESDTNATYSTPFTSGANFTGWDIGALFYSPSTLDDGTPIVSGGGIAVAGYTVASRIGRFSAAFDTPPMSYLDSIRQSDIAMFGPQFAIWINGTQPTFVYGGFELPDIVFPFRRLASVTLADGSATFIYHQINGTTFAEEQWDNSLEAWIPSVYITESDS